VHELPDDKFTVVLKKVRGEDAVPLFQTLTFHINAVHPSPLHAHMLSLYEKGSELYDYVSEQTTSGSYTVYALITVAVLAFVATLVKIYKWCCRSKA